MALTRGQALAELERRGALPAEFKGELEDLRKNGDKESLAQLDPGRAALVKAIGEGRQSPPTSRNKDSQLLMEQVAVAFPGYNAADAKAQQAIRTDLARGKTADQLKSLNTAIGHIGSLSSSLDALGNVQVPLLTQPINAVKNWASNASGNPEVTRATMDRQAVADELETTFRGGRGGTLHGTKGWQESLPLNGSPEQQSAAMQEALHLLSARVGAIGDQYGQAMGRASDGISLLSPEAQDTVRQLSKRYGVPIPGAIGGMGGPPSVGGGGAPPAGPAGGGAPMAPTQGMGPGGATLGTTTRNEITPEAQAQATALEKGINDGTVKSVDEALALSPYANRAEVQRALDYRAKGGTGHIDIIANRAKPQASDAVGAAAGGLANSLTFGALPKLGALASAAGSAIQGNGFSGAYQNALAENNATLDQAESAHPIASLAGNVGGYAVGAGALGSVPGLAGMIGRLPSVARPAAMDALYGAMTGAGSSDNLGDVAGNAGTDAAAMAAGGMLGRGAVKGLAAAVAPAVSPIVRRLADAGITMTPGQIMGAGGGRVGNFVKGVEDRLAGIPGIGDAINGVRRQGVNDFNRVAIDEALAPVGGNVPKDLSGRDAITWAQKHASDAYDTALSPMRFNADLPFANDVAAVQSQISKLPPAHRDDLKAIWDSQVAPLLPQKGQQYTGAALQDIKQTLSKASAGYRGNGPIEDIKADALDSLQNSFLDLAARQAPAEASGYRAADAAYRNMTKINNAAARSKTDGVFTPAQLSMAAAKRGYGVSDATVAAGNAPMQDLANAAQSVLPNAVPDSGTAGRLILGSALGMMGGGSQGEGVGDGVGKAAAGSLVGAALLSPMGAKALQKLLIQRGPGAIAAADAMRSAAPMVGSLTAPALLSYRNTR